MILEAQFKEDNRKKLISGKLKTNLILLKRLCLYLLLYTRYTELLLRDIGQ
jgi:hypothetical protein